MSARVRSQGGFTLMELMVVISIIALLLVLVSPSLWKMYGRGEISREKAIIQQVRLAVKALTADAAHGDLPPSFLDAPDSVFEESDGVMPNRVNTGIESLVAYFHRKDFRGESPFTDEDRLLNTDEDSSKKAVTEFGTRELLEYVDSWGTPLVYIRLRDFEEGARPLTVTEPVGDDYDEIDIVPEKNKKLGVFHGHSDGFQIISAGPDREFGTKDDLTSWKE